VHNVKVGDRALIHCGVWDRHSPAVKNGDDPMYDPSSKLGYETTGAASHSSVVCRAAISACQGVASDVGRGPQPNTGRRDCVPDADGDVARTSSAAATCVIGARRVALDAWRFRPRQARRPNFRGHSSATIAKIILHEARRPRMHSTEKIFALGMMPHWKETAAYNQMGGRKCPRVAKRFGHRREREKFRGIVFRASRAKTRCRLRCSSATRAGWS